MKRKVLISTLASALVLGGAFAVGAANNDSKTVPTLNNGKSQISIEEAKKIGLKEVAGRVDSVELEGTPNNGLYKVEIDKDLIEYDVYIDAQSGKVHSVVKDDQFDDDDSYDDNGSDGKGSDDTAVAAINTGNTVQTNAGTISQDEAIKIAEGAVNGKMYEIDRDEDDGFNLYEVELTTDRGKAEVDIDAATGKVLKVEYDN